MIVNLDPRTLPKVGCKHRCGVLQTIGTSETLRLRIFKGLWGINGSGLGLIRRYQTDLFRNTD
jgi:hypothetical protein